MSAVALCRAALPLLPASLALALGAAHFWRAAEYPVSAVCLSLALLLWFRPAWLRPVLCTALGLLAARWVWTAAQLVQIRQFMGEPWLRLALILGGVALFTVLAALPLTGVRGSGRFLDRDAAPFSLTAFVLTCATLGGLHAAAPHLLLADRLAPGWGVFQAFALGLWAAWVASRLNAPAQGTATRMGVWRLFSLCFFGQLLLGLTGYTVFLMNGQLHLPVPGLILAAPLYRGHGFFMLGLFAVSVLLAGAAWCSHLCYFGVWDATAAQRRPAKGLPGWMRHSAALVLGLVGIAALTMRAAHMPTEVGIAAGILLGLPILPMVAWYNRRHGICGYCAGICPLGVMARWLGRFSPWRVRVTEKCIRCRRCFRDCHYGALNEAALAAGTPNSRCTLCRNCIHACRHKGMELRLAGLPQITALSGVTAERMFSTLLAALHAVFLGVAMV